jgi:signal transduction histidine kinase/DNA-binding response OmpR family regulator
MYQVQTEFLRLREQLQQHQATPDAQAVQLRYDIFVSRLSMLATDRARRLLAGSAVSKTAMNDLAAFTQQADLYMGPDSKGALSPAASRALLDQLQALDAPIQRMLLDASHRVAEQITERQQQVSDHNRIGLGLTGFLLAMVLLFAGMALRQMRQLDQRRGRLQTLADALREARIAAESASKAKSDFLADMSHELRTPLHGLLGMLTLVRDAPQDKRAGDWMASADESANHLLRLLDDMLDLSKLEAGTLALSPRPVHLATLQREVLTLLRPAAAAKGLTLRCQMASELPEHVLFDPTRVKQILYNLLGNAVKFSDRGVIVLHCRVQDSGGSGTQKIAGPSPDMPSAAGGGPGAAQLVFDVADTGIGMDADTVARLFQRYSRARDPRARVQGGTGLGLAISRNLASLMGGDIQVRSTPGQGSVFSFSCPLVPAQAPAGATVAGHVPVRQLQVLVAEDHPVNRQYMAALLERLGHAVRLVENGLDAVKAAKSRGFDLVLMDVHMPVMDGVSATRAIRRLNPTGAGPCIVALTADVFGDTHDRCIAAGAVEVATKPLSLAALQTLLDRHFGPGVGQAHPVLPVAAVAPAAADATPPAELLDAQAALTVRELMRHGEAANLYETFFDQTLRAVLTMRRAMRDADVEAIRREAHGVKGAALHLGLQALGESADRLSSNAASLTAAELALAVQRFEELTQASKAFCQDQGLLRLPA